MFRIHRSTWVVVAMLTAGLVFWNIPGNRRKSLLLDYEGIPNPEVTVAERLEHGWPWVYLKREP